jgi:sugar lactone lactonase YvrE
MNTPLSDLSVQPILDARARLGEGPVWVAAAQTLFWVDVYNHRVHQFDPASGKDRYFNAGDVVGALAPAGPDQLIIAQRHSLAFLNTQTGDIQPLVQLDFPSPSDTRCNDGKCDPQGRFWIGTCSGTPGAAALYRYDPDGTVQTMETGLTISNGLGWSPDSTTFYLTDSAVHKIYAYDFEPDAGVIRNRRVLIDLSAEAVEPDGLTIDSQGNIWSALWGGWAIACFAPTGQEIGRIKMPVPRPTSLTFGGKDLSDLYITSASVDMTQTELQDCYIAGDLFHLSTQSTGLPTNRFGGTDHERASD